MTIRVLIADDQKLVRDGYRALLCREREIDVIGEARDGQQAIEMTQTLDPDVITMDIKMPHLDGIEATKRIGASNSHSKILMVALSWDHALITRAMQLGARGYVAKTDLTELAPAIRAAYDGKLYFSKHISDYLSRELVTPPQSLAPDS